MLLRHMQGWKSRPLLPARDPHQNTAHDGDSAPDFVEASRLATCISAAFCLACLGVALSSACGCALRTATGTCIHVLCSTRWLYNCSGLKASGACSMGISMFRAISSATRNEVSSLIVGCFFFLALLLLGGFLLPRCTPVAVALQLHQL